MDNCLFFFFALMFSSCSFMWFSGRMLLSSMQILKYDFFLTVWQCCSSLFPFFALHPHFLTLSVKSSVFSVFSNESNIKKTLLIYNF